jgi:hypothetical protein
MGQGASSTDTRAGLSLVAFLAAAWLAALGAGIALCVRLLGTVLPLPGLGVGLRMVAAPTTLAVVALVVSAATRPLEPELTFVLATALPLILLAPVPLLLSARRTRWAVAPRCRRGGGVASRAHDAARSDRRRGSRGASC